MQLRLTGLLAVMLVVNCHRLPAFQLPWTPPVFCLLTFNCLC
jgi:hypothetical protein